MHLILQFIYSKGAWNKGQTLSGGVEKKRLRTTSFYNNSPADGARPLIEAPKDAESLLVSGKN